MGGRDTSAQSTVVRPVTMPVEGDAAQTAERREQSLTPAATQYTLVLLAGALRPSPLRQELDIPVLALPLAADTTVLDRWLRCVSGSHCVAIHIVTSTEADAARLRKQIESLDAPVHDANITVHVDPRQWRGPAGLLHDVVDNAALEDDSLLIAAEASCLAPNTLDPMFAACEPSCMGVVGADRDGRPAGVYAFRALAARRIPSRGFYDIKEQLLPELHCRGSIVRCAMVTQHAVRIRDRASYINAMLTCTQRTAERSDRCTLLDGALIDDSANIAPDAVIHQSIILAGATVGRGAVVSRCVLAPTATVNDGQRVRERIVTTVQPRHLPPRRAALNRPERGR